MGTSSQAHNNHDIMVAVTALIVCHTTDSLAVHSAMQAEELVCSNCIRPLHHHTSMSFILSWKSEVCGDNRQAFDALSLRETERPSSGVCPSSPSPLHPPPPLSAPPPQGAEPYTQHVYDEHV